MKKSLLSTYSDIRAAIAFITRTLRLPKHVVTEAALAAVKVIHRHRTQSQEEAHEHSRHHQHSGYPVLPDTNLATPAQPSRLLA